MNLFQNLFDRQRSLFATGKTRSYAWRIEQLDRMARSLSENEEALQRAVGQDFKTAPGAVLRDLRLSRRGCFPEGPAQGLDGSGGSSPSNGDRRYRAPWSRTTSAPTCPEQECRLRYYR